jgi:hypothetical protein
VTEQFENPQEEKVEDATIISPSPKEKIDRVAEKAAEKATKRVQHNDKDRGIFTI